MTEEQEEWKKRLLLERLNQATLKAQLAHFGFKCVEDIPIIDFEREKARLEVNDLCSEIEASWRKEEK